MECAVVKTHYGMPEVSCIINPAHARGYATRRVCQSVWQKRVVVTSRVLSAIALRSPVVQVSSCKTVRDRGQDSLPPEICHDITLTFKSS